MDAELDARYPAPKDAVTEITLDTFKASRIAGLDPYVNLQSLSLNGVGLTSLEGLPTLRELRRLELNDNPRITGGLDILVKVAPNLHTLHLCGSKVATLDQLRPLSELESLRHLDMYGSPIDQTPNYRQRVFSLIPSLKTLDGQDRNGIDAGSEEDEEEEEEEEGGIRSFSLQPEQSLAAGKAKAEVAWEFDFDEAFEASRAAKQVQDAAEDTLCASAGQAEEPDGGGNAGEVGGQAAGIYVAESGGDRLRLAQSVELRSFSAHGEIIDIVAHVTVVYEFVCSGPSVLDAQFLFPVDEGAAVCMFEALIDGVRLVGTVKEIEQAKREYNTAVETGEQALLLQQKAPSIFQLSLGNIPAKSAVSVKLAFVCELETTVNQRQIFRLPLSLNAPTLSQASFGDISVNVTVGIETLRKISLLRSPTHKIRTKQTETVATVQAIIDTIEDAQSTFILELASESSTHARVWSEKHPIFETNACMLVLSHEPQTFIHNVSTIEGLNEISIIVDFSASMKPYKDKILAAATTTIDNLSDSVIFNVHIFGSYTEQLFVKPQHSKFLKNRIAAKQFLETTLNKAHFGASRLHRVISQIFLRRTQIGATVVTNAILFSDFFFDDFAETVGLFRDTSVESVRIFGFVIGAASSSTNSEYLSAVSGGSSEKLEDYIFKSPSRLSAIVKQQLCRCVQVSVSQLKIDWQTNSPAHSGLQAPKCVPSIFGKDRRIVYMLFPRGVECHRVIVRGSVRRSLSDASESVGIEIVVGSSDVTHTDHQSTLLHSLATQKTVRDLTLGVYHPDPVEDYFEKLNIRKQIVELSCKHQIVSPFTAFVAVRDKHSQTKSINMKQWIPVVDRLSYMDWEPYVSLPYEEEQELLRNSLSLEPRLFLEDTPTGPSSVVAQVTEPRKPKPQKSGQKSLHTYQPPPAALTFKMAFSQQPPNTEPVPRATYKGSGSTYVHQHVPETSSRRSGGAGPIEMRKKRADQFTASPDAAHHHSSPAVRSVATKTIITPLGVLAPTGRTLETQLLTHGLFGVSNVHGECWLNAALALVLTLQLHAQWAKAAGLSAVQAPKSSPTGVRWSDTKAQPALAPQRPSAAATSTALSAVAAGGAPLAPFWSSLSGLLLLWQSQPAQPHTEKSVSRFRQQLCGLHSIVWDHFAAAGFVRTKPHGLVAALQWLFGALAVAPIKQDWVLKTISIGALTLSRLQQLFASIPSEEARKFVVVLNDSTGGSVEEAVVQAQFAIAHGSRYRLHAFCSFEQLPTKVYTFGHFTTIAFVSEPCAGVVMFDDILHLRPQGWQGGFVPASPHASPIALIRPRLARVPALVFAAI
eukprot:TRINITY_DN1568_c1_g4_i1.p1 TRINITY_DN1568_c1_g4~~TRINITY_DN1568_c1_g4_i1.p1  ORF type:complete len:1321 (+),score=317.18 TRINITY_DN1568_c1_g4_i1:1-3963(+)